MKISRNDVGDVKERRIVLVDGHQVLLDWNAIKVWDENPEAVFDAVWKPGRKLFTLAGYE